MDEHTQTVGGGQASCPGRREQLGFGGIVNHIKNAAGSRELPEIDGEGIFVFKPGTRGVDDEGARGEIGGGGGRRKADQGYAASQRTQMGEEGVAVRDGAVGEVEGRAALRETFDGGPAGRATGAEENDGSAGKLDTETFGHGGGEAITVGIESLPTGGSALEGVDGADGASDGVDLVDEVAGEYLVGHGQIQTVKARRVESGEGDGEVGWRHLEAEVAPGVETRIALGHRGQSGVVHSRADRVLDGVAEHGEGSAVEGPLIEISKSENRLHGRVVNHESRGIHL